MNSIFRNNSCIFFFLVDCTIGLVHIVFLHVLGSWEGLSHNNGPYKLWLYHNLLVCICNNPSGIVHIGSILQLHSSPRELSGCRYYLVGNFDSSGHYRLVQVHRFLGPGYC